jgi:hypothetical protein
VLDGYFTQEGEAFQGLSEDKAQGKEESCRPQAPEEERIPRCKTQSSSEEGESQGQGQDESQGEKAATGSPGILA